MVSESHADIQRRVLQVLVGGQVVGAAALGDIGSHFPDTSEKYKGADSITLASEVAQMLREAGYAIGNIDITLLAQKPKIALHTSAMRDRLSEALGIPRESISIKATTEEGLGFTGTGEGIAAHCVCLLCRV